VVTVVHQCIHPLKVFLRVVIRLMGFPGICGIILGEGEMEDSINKENMYAKQESEL